MKQSGNVASVMALANPRDPTSLAEYPVTVLAVIGTEMKDEDGVPIDFAFVRYFVVLARKGEHPVVESCGYVAEPLVSRAEYSLVPVSHLVRPVFLVPCVRCTSSLEPRTVRAHGSRLAKYFWLDPLRPEELV